MQVKNFFKGITKNIVLLGFVSLFTDMSSQMVFPLIPLFLTEVLHSSASIVGIVEGAAETTASLLKVFSGYWSDKIKRRKPFVLAGYSLSTITKPLFALATVWPFVLFIRIIERIGKGVRSAPRDAIVAESTDPNHIGGAYGFQRSLDGFGSILGALLVVLLLPLLGYKNLFLFAFIPGIIAVILILFIKEKKVVIPFESKKLKLNFRTLPTNLKFFLFISAIFSLGHFGYAFLLLRAKSLGLENHTAVLLYTLFYTVHTIFSIPFGKLSDQIGRKNVLMSGYFLFVLISAGLIFSSSQTIFLAFLFYGLFYAMIDGVQRAFVVDLAPKNLKATALGTFHTIAGLVALPGGFMAGLLWDKISPEATFIYGSVLALTSVILFLFIKE